MANNFKKTIDPMTNDTNLTYKDHQEFFNDYYNYKKTFIQNISGCYIDITLIPETAISLSTFIMSNYAQLQVRLEFSDLEKKQKTIFKMIKDKNKPEKIIEQMKALFSEIILICSNLELEPKPTEEFDTEEVKFWKEETHKGLREIKKGFIDILSIKNG